METIILLLYGILISLVLLALRAYSRPLVLFGRFLVRLPSAIRSLFFYFGFKLLLKIKLYQNERLFRSFERKKIRDNNSSK